MPVAMLTKAAVALAVFLAMACTVPHPQDRLLVVREIASGIDHNHCTTRQFQHMVFHHQGVWFVFYSDGADFRYQTSADGGVTWRQPGGPITPAPNGSSSFDLVKAGDSVFLAHSHYPQGRYDPAADYARNPSRRQEYTTEGRVKMGRIAGRTIEWLEDRDPGFTPDYTNLVRDTGGHLWVFHRSNSQVVAHRSLQPNRIAGWSPEMVCLPVEGRHAADSAALDNGMLYVASVLTTDGKLYGNLYDGERWGPEPVLLSDEMTTVAGDDRRLAIQFDSRRGELHLVYIDRDSRLLYRRLRAPFRDGDWNPPLAEPPRELATGVFTHALAMDASNHSAGLVVVYGLERYRDDDERFRTGEIYARRFDGQQWQGAPVLLTGTGTSYNWYPNVNQDASPGLCLLYSRSVSPEDVRQPLAAMVSVARLD